MYQENTGSMALLHTFIATDKSMIDIGSWKERRRKWYDIFMNPTVIAIMFTLGAGTWIYSQMYSRTGGNTQSAAIIAVASGVAIFVLLYLVMTFIFNYTTN